MSEAIERLEAAALSPATRRAYAGHLRRMAASGLSPRAWWLGEAESRSASWLGQARSALMAAGVWDPDLERAHRGAMRLARGRAAEGSSRAAAPLALADLDAVVRRRGESGTRRDRRVIDLMVLGWWAGLRVSEIAALRSDDLGLESSGVQLTIRASKGCVGPSHVWLPRRPGAAVCPHVAASRLVLSGRVELWPMSCRTLERRISEVLRAEAREGVIRRGRYTSHSLRAGLATELDAAGVGVGSIARAGRWRSIGCVLRYVRERGDSPLARLSV